MSTGQTVYFRELRTLLELHYSAVELEVLCYDLVVEYADLKGDTRPLKIVSLVKYLARRGRLEELMTILRDGHPTVRWPEVPDPARQAQDARTTSFLSQKGALEEQYQIALHWDGTTRMREFDLSGRNLSKLSLVGADLTGSRMRGTDLFQSNLSGADLSGTDLHRANLWHANLRRARLLERPILFHADLNGANLSEAKLFAANLHGAQLNGANMQGTELIATDLSHANMSHADLRGADLRRAVNLLEATLDGAEFDSRTKWPDGFDPQSQGAILFDS